jgi:hypothetical protein
MKYVVIAVVALACAWPSVKTAAVEKMTRQQLAKQFGVGAVIAAPLADPVMRGAWDQLNLVQQVVLATHVLLFEPESRP